MACSWPSSGYAGRTAMAFLGHGAGNVRSPEAVAYPWAWYRGQGEQ